MSFKWIWIKYRNFLYNVKCSIFTETFLVLRKCLISLVSFPLRVPYLVQTTWHCLIQIFSAMTLYLWHMRNEIALTDAVTFSMLAVSNQIFYVLKIHLTYVFMRIPPRGCLRISLISPSPSLDPYYPGCLALAVVALPLLCAIVSHWCHKQIELVNIIFVPSWSIRRRQLRLKTNYHGSILLI